MKEFITYSRVRWGIIFCLLILLLDGCNRSIPIRYSPEERAGIDSVIQANSTTDSLKVWLDHYARTENIPGMMLVYKELGRRYREETCFNEAIACLRKGLQLAVELSDTLEIIQALNNIGTNFRRMGILDEASTYHYKALLFCEQYSDKKSFTAKKNRVVSLNGIGNIHFTLDNRDAADSIFRAALAGERELGSDLGQAINYANLGSLFEARGMTDSALVYYRRSMEYNRAANSILGISLCYTHFGRLFEQKGNWDEALREYRNAYDLMEGKSDRWHWLESCIALARVNILKSNIPAAEIYLKRAEKTAEEIRSWEHLSEVYRLSYLCYEKQGNCRRALNAYILSRAYADSVKNTENLNHVQNLRVNYEKEKNSRELTLIRENYRMRQRTQSIFLIASLLALLLAVVILVFLWYILRLKSRNQRVMRRMEKVRSNFFTNVTHEFRTPLTVILGISEQLQREDIDGREVKAGLLVIRRQGKNLLGLVNQLLEVSKVKSELGEPEWRTGDVVAYIRMILENYQVYARQKQIDLRFIPAETVIHMDFVPEYLRKIIRNLLSNAIKFTLKGGQITVTLVREKNKLVIRVTDTGCGISAENLPHIFDMFYQGEESGLNRGTGIGLSLVKQMTECMEGEVYVVSTKGKGSVFTVALPLHHRNSIGEKWIPEAEAEETYAFSDAESISNLPEPGEGLDDASLSSILIVEDNVDISYYIGELLKGNYRQLYARNGKEALEIAKEYMPDLIITDLMMPEMDGYELCREIRCSEILNHIPIIIITARCEETDRVRGLDVGADAYLQKPFNPEELNTRIAKLLEQRRLLREKYSLALQEGKEPAGGLNIADRKFLSRLNDFIYSFMTNRNLNSDMLADKMCMSRSQLNRKVRSITGYNTSSYILQIRLERAKRMLSSTEDLIGDIAFQCGFEDANYFTRLFKQVFAITPTQYRKKLNP